MIISSMALGLNNFSFLFRAIRLCLCWSLVCKIWQFLHRILHLSHSSISWSNVTELFLTILQISLLLLSGLIWSKSKKRGRSALVYPHNVQPSALRVSVYLLLHRSIYEQVSRKSPRSRAIVSIMWHSAHTSWHFLASHLMAASQDNLLTQFRFGS